jgi:hypothetical protein
MRPGFWTIAAVLLSATLTVAAKSPVRTPSLSSESTSPLDANDSDGNVLLNLWSDPQCIDEAAFLLNMTTALVHAGNDNVANDPSQQAMRQLSHSFFEDQLQEIEDADEGNLALQAALSKRWAGCSLAGYTLDAQHKTRMLTWLQASADRDDTEALVHLATLTALGSGVDQSYPRAYKLYMQTKDKRRMEVDFTRFYDLEGKAARAQSDITQRLAAYTFAYEELLSYRLDNTAVKLVPHAGKFEFGFTLSPCRSYASIDMENTDPEFDMDLLQSLLQASVDHLPSIEVSCELQTLEINNTVLVTRLH